MSIENRLNEPVDRRSFLKGLACSVGAASLVMPPGLLLGDSEKNANINPDGTPKLQLKIGDMQFDGSKEKRTRFPNRSHGGDYIETKDIEPKIKSIFVKLYAVEKSVGSGNYYTIGFDELLKRSRFTSTIQFSRQDIAYLQKLGIKTTEIKPGRFTPDELKYMEELFSRDAKIYGFMGDKPITNISYIHLEGDTIRIQKGKGFPMGEGQNLVRGASFETAMLIDRLLRDENGNWIVKDKKGNDIKYFITSGVRGVPKQFSLFIAKVLRLWSQTNIFNFSAASRSVAPPGFSFHGISDFDIGSPYPEISKYNFEQEFADTALFQFLSKLEFLELRYSEHNGELTGVRFEPWHVKVKSVHEEVKKRRVISEIQNELRLGLAEYHEERRDVRSELSMFS